VSSGAGLVLDAGAFVALESGNRFVVSLFQRFADEATPLVTSAGVVAQVWRGGVGPNVPLVFILRRTVVVDLTAAVARTLGRMLGNTRTKDPIDAHVVLLASERGWPVLTSDPDDLLAIDPTLVVHAV
jgi:hypothetical protein